MTRESVRREGTRQPQGKERGREKWTATLYNISQQSSNRFAKMARKMVAATRISHATRNPAMLRPRNYIREKRVFVCSVLLLSKEEMEEEKVAREMKRERKIEREESGERELEQPSRVTNKVEKGRREI